MKRSLIRIVAKAKLFNEKSAKLERQQKAIEGLKRKLEAATNRNVKVRKKQVPPSEEDLEETDDDDVTDLEEEDAEEEEDDEAPAEAEEEADVASPKAKAKGKGNGPAFRALAKPQGELDQIIRKSPRKKSPSKESPRKESPAAKKIKRYPKVAAPRRGAATKKMLAEEAADKAQEGAAAEKAKQRHCRHLAGLLVAQEKNQKAKAKREAKKVAAAAAKDDKVTAPTFCLV